jgi:hypothetical protein
MPACSHRRYNEPPTINCSLPTPIEQGRRSYPPREEIFLHLRAVRGPACNCPANAHGLVISALRGARASPFRDIVSPDHLPQPILQHPPTDAAGHSVHDIVMEAPILPRDPSAPRGPSFYGSGRWRGASCPSGTSPLVVRAARMGYPYARPLAVGSFPRHTSWFNDPPVRRSGCAQAVSQPMTPSTDRCGFLLPARCRRRRTAAHREPACPSPPRAHGRAGMATRRRTSRRDGRL